jgi:hypothetical protein
VLAHHPEEAGLGAEEGPRLAHLLKFLVQLVLRTAPALTGVVLPLRAELQGFSLSALWGTRLPIFTFGLNIISIHISINKFKGVFGQPILEVASVHQKSRYTRSYCITFLRLRSNRFLPINWLEEV